MDANEAINIISRERNDAIVVSTMTPTRYWQDVSNSENLDLDLKFGLHQYVYNIGNSSINVNWEINGKKKSIIF